MASKRIQGITIEINGDTTKLTKALQDVEKQVSASKNKMKDINNLLKADPKNVELLTQKQKAFTDAIDGTKKKLEQEKEALKQLDAKPQTEDTIRQHEALEREIIATTQELDKLEAEYKEFGSVSQQQAKVAADAMVATGEKIQKVGQGVYNVGSTMTRNITVPIVAGFTASAKAAIDWETAFTGVQKTVDASEEEYEQLADAIKQMSTEMASSKAEIAGVMEIAGQLGVSGVDNLIAFTRTAVMLGDTTNLSAEEAATSLARILNITGDGFDKVDELGSVVVDLGNNFATTESEITEMATRLASAGKISGLTTQEIFALSAAMSSVGIQAEAGGTAMAQTLKGIQSAISDAQAPGATDKERKKLETLARVAKMSATDFANAWKNEPMKAIQNFIQGLSDINDVGGDTFATLDELGMSGIRQSNMLQSLALASGVLGDATQTANKAWSENTALSAEAEKRYATMAAKLSQLKEQLSNAALVVGERLMPYLEKLVDAIGKAADRFASLSDEQVDGIIKLAAFAAAIGPVLMAIGKLIIGFGSLIKAIGAIKGAFAAGGIFAGAGEAIGGVAASIGGLLPPIAAVIAAIAVWVHNWEEIKEAAGLFVERTIEHMTALHSFISEKLALIKEAYIITGYEIERIVTEIWEAIKTAIVDKTTAAINTIKEFFTGLGEFFRNLIQTARQWGADIINGIKDGITSKIAEVKQAAANVGNAIKSYLHFSEPDVGPLSDFNSWMPDMMSQMAQQINAGIPGVTAAMQNATGAMRDSIDYSGQLAGINNSLGQLAGAGGVGGDITIPVYIGNQKFAQAVASAEQLNKYRSGGR